MKSASKNWRAIWKKVALPDKKANDLYVSFAAESCSDIHVQNIRHSCGNFCSFIQLSGGASLGDVSYPLLEKYDLEGRKNSIAFSITEGLVEGFLSYWTNQGAVSYGLGFLCTISSPQES